MKDLVLKEFDGKQVRSRVDEQGQVWFVAQDVCEVLDIKYQRHALRKLDEDQRGGVIIPGNGGDREFSAVSESGLYALVLASKKPSAKAFRRWVTDEVLPAIRKTGTYSLSGPVYSEMSPVQRLEMHLEFMKRTEAELMKQKKFNDEIATKMLVVSEEAKQDRDTLTHDQISELDQLMHERFRKFGGEYKTLSLMKRALKAEFFEIKGTRTWKEIPRSGMDRAREIISTFVPPAYLTAAKQMSMMKSDS